MGKKSQQMSAILSILALFISGGTFYYVAKTYSVQYRPYIGIIKIEHELTGDPPTTIRWVCALKNKGSIPAWVTLDEHVITLTTDGVEENVPIITEARGRVQFIMPEQTFYIEGLMSDTEGRASVRDLLDGRTTLDVTVRLSYESRGILYFKNKYTYAARSRLAGRGFFMVSAEAD